MLFQLQRNVLIPVLGAACEHIDTHNTQQLPGAGCSGHCHSPSCQFVLVGSKTEFFGQGVSWAAVPCAHPGDPELRPGVSGAGMVVPQQQTSSPVWEREQPPLPVCSCISLGREGTCRDSKLCSFPGALSGSAVGARGVTPRALSAASTPWGNPSVWLRAVPIPIQQQKEVELFLEALKCLLC